MTQQPPATEFQARVEAAKRWCVAAGRLTLDWFQKPAVGFERKPDQSPVTIADRSAEQWLRKEILNEFGHDHIVGEEFGKHEGANPWRWILDPIDGTKSFISGVPLYGTMVGVEYDGECVIGVVYVPGLDEGIYAAQGSGAWHFRGNGAPQRAYVSKKQKLSECIFVTSEVKTFETRNARATFDTLQAACYMTRTWGDCYGYLLVATGRVDLMIDPRLSVWDAAAVKPILEQAGGCFVDWQGIPSIHSGEAIGCHPEILQQVLAITREAPRLTV
jgi:histidinol-phosphatase